MTPTEHVCSAHEDKIYCFAAIGDKNKATIYSDLPGKFPVRSYDGMVYTYIYFLRMFINLPLSYSVQ